MTSPTGRRIRAWVPTLQGIGEAVLTLVTTTLGLAVAVWLIDGVRSDNPGAIVLAAVVVAVGDLLLGAPLRFLARRGSAVLALGLGLLAQVGLDCPPRTLVSTLSPGWQQLVEIAKALGTNARVLIMDEPTSSLSQHETDQLYRVVKDLRSRGVSVTRPSLTARFSSAP